MEFFFNSAKTKLNFLSRFLFNLVICAVCTAEFMCKTWVCSCYSVITEQWKCDVFQQATACLLTEISTFTFPEAAVGANIRPICTLARHANAFVHLRGREWGQDGALYHISGCTLAELSSLACTGYTSQLRGNHSVGNIRFHLSPIQSGTYLEQRLCMPQAKKQGKGMF